MSDRTARISCDPDLKAQLLQQRIPYSEAFRTGAEILLKFNISKEGEIMGEMEKIKKEIKVLNNKYKFLEKKLKELKGGKGNKEAREKVKIAERINQGIKANNPLRHL